LAPPEPRRADYAARVEALSITDPIKKERALGVAEAEFGRAHALWKEKLDMAGDAAVAWVVANPGQSVELMPRPMWHAMDPRQQIAIRDAAKKAGKVESSPQTVETWWRLKQMAVSTDPKVREQFAAIRPIDLIGKLPDGEVKEILNLVAAVKTGDPAKMTTLISPQEHVNNYKRSIGIDPTPGDDKSKNEKNAAFDYQAQRRFNEAERIKGKPLDYDERKKILESLVIGVPGTGGWFGARVPVAKMRLSDVPAKDRTEIIDAMRAKNKTITDEAIIDLFVKRQTQGGAR
jgi:hypothetical protein